MKYVHFGESFRVIAKNFLGYNVAFAKISELHSLLSKKFHNDRIFKFFHEYQHAPVKIISNLRLDIWQALLGVYLCAKDYGSQSLSYSHKKCPPGSKGNLESV